MNFSVDTHFSIGIFEHWIKQKTFAYTLKGKDLTKYYKVVAGTNFHLPKSVTSMIGKNTAHYYLCVMYPAGGLYAFKESPFSEEAAHIMQRFADGFHLAYTRYEDLQNSEARAREAIKAASLDRVRAEIASMRTKEDLEKITPLIWTELTTLGIPFFRCGIFIVDELNKNVQVFLTTPSGGSQTSLVLPFGSSDVLSATIAQWRQKRIFTDYWSKDRFIAWTNSVIAEGYVKSSDEYGTDAEAPDHIALHFLPFAQGMLYVGSDESLTESELEITQALADAFSVAYARYEDFASLEDAKTRVESTLVELQAAQNQLIHSEKMASLGELTAGIAHEIQNPLNFVNNFSEVSSELIEEAQEELKKGDIEEANDILTDLIQNLDKINHHGQRASSIVKGMLDHSRTSSGEKVPTDINALCDEYLRLAYHGMRAKDKGFNVKFETDFQQNLPKINILSQDIGRVILNLVNNAFQACQAKAEAEEYQALVLLKTELVGRRPGFNPSGAEAGAGDKSKLQRADSPLGVRGERRLKITISDNGPGIPEEIKDKIFQPFFTTKVTGQGTGLGLSLSYDIVKAHGGEVAVGKQGRRMDRIFY